MAEHDTEAVIMICMGGPENLDEIPTYLRNIFSDRMLIRLSGGPFFQKLLARLISRLRSKKVKRHYEQIGGKSPLLQWTRSQAEQVEQTLNEKGNSIRTYIAARYCHPTIGEAIQRSVDDGCRRIYFLPMYPHYCRATTGSSFVEARKQLERFPEVAAVFIDDFHDDADYCSLMNSYISDCGSEDDMLLFSAHAIPQSLVDEGDPYVRQVKRTAELVANGRNYAVSFQSRTGPVKWVGPDTIEEAKRLSQQWKGKLLVIPLSFVCDNIETLYEIDIELDEIVRKTTGFPVRRMAMFNDDARFARMLANLVRTKMSNDA